MPLSNKIKDFNLSKADGPIDILSRRMKPETPQAYVNRIMREQDLSHVRVSERAKKKGHKLSSSYIHEIARGTSVNPTIGLLKAIAAGLGRPVEEVIKVWLGQRVTDEVVYSEGFWADLSDEYHHLPSAEQKEVKPLLEMLRREIQRRLVP